MSKTADRLAKRFADRVDTTVLGKGIWFEYDGYGRASGSWWAALKPGWRCTFTDAGSCHERTLKHLEEALKAAKFKEEWKECQ